MRQRIHKDLRTAKECVMVSKVAKIGRIRKTL